MSDAHDTRLQQMRAAFDESFARAWDTRRPEVVSLLALEIEDHAYALPVAGLRSVERDRAYVPLPVRRPGLLGLAGVRGHLVPVWSLAGLLGRSVSGSPRWLALVQPDGGGAEECGLAFASFSGTFEVPPEAITATDDRFVAGVVEHRGGMRSVLSVEQLVREVTRRAGSASSGDGHG